MNRRLWNGIWVTELCADDGATALVADKGAHVLSWKPADGDEALFLSPRSGYGEGTAIRGGVPIIFPQFNRRGTGMRHGFARLAKWQPVSCGMESNHAIARYALTQSDVAGFGWNQAFAATYEVALRGKELRLLLMVENMSDKDMEFTAALHTYLKVGDIAAVRLSGFKGVSYTDFAGEGSSGVQQEEFVRKVEDTDCLFTDVEGPILVHDGARKMTSYQRGFRDAVVWNPGAEITKTMADLEPEAYHSFLCVEPGAVEHPVVLSPQEKWVGGQTLIVD
jgi:glucose-6-phosphate 1-epimerase